MTTCKAIRKQFLDYFQQLGHEIIASSSLVPAKDPTLLFTNAGMVQFKDVFLGREQRPYSRAASSQRCVRAGGKHNDLENVGYTARHHTFFEMLGNFSFGDYFKRDAIKFSWDFLTTQLQIRPEKLWITVYEDDDEAADIWLNEIGIDSSRFSRCGAADNFWSMGDTGPCGPCSEIFYDHGDDIAGGPPGSAEQDGDRYIEIWNMVFMQYDRQASGEMLPLPRPAVDTGMGLERIAAVMQGVHNNYDIDLFQHLLSAIAEITHQTDATHTSLRVIADHIRSCSFLIVDGVIPSNEGRGYVLRRIIRRAIRHGHKLGLRDPFFYQLVAPLAIEMGEAYPELTHGRALVEQILLKEEQQFAVTLDQGLRILAHDIEQLSGNCIPGSTIFKLYDTYGFPPDLTGDIARERDLQLDLEGFEQEMARQKQQSQHASKFAAHGGDKLVINHQSEFRGYNALSHEDNIVGLFYQGQPVKKLSVGQEGWVIMNSTPFYAEGGGQVGDQGILQTPEALFIVNDTQKQGKAYLHQGVMKRGLLHVGDNIQAIVSAEKRRQTALNHSATHLLHAALRQLLGDHVQQKGSLVDTQRLRFDFSHFQPLSQQQLVAIEQLVNEKIQANLLVDTQYMTQEQAISQGALALFGEKYAEQVRVLQMGDFSMELCGGTHVERTGDIGLFKITAETGIAAGIRRIEAVTGMSALSWLSQSRQQIQQLASLLKVNPDQDITDKVKQLIDNHRQLEKQLQKLQQKITVQHGTELLNLATQVAGINLLVTTLEGQSVKNLRDTLDHLKQKIGTGVIVLTTVHSNKVNLIVGVSKDLIDKIHAGKLANFIAQQVDGKGGGRPDMAQAGGQNSAALTSALQSISAWVEEKMG